MATLPHSVSLERICRFLLISLLSMSAVAKAQDQPAPVLDDSGVIGDRWFEDFYPNTQSLPLDFGFRASSEQTEGSFSTLVPLTDQPGGDAVAFLTFAATFRENRGESFSLGIGSRFIIDPINAVVGFRFHGDITQTAFENQVTQLSGGVDVMTASGIDLHANFYLPDDEAQLGLEILEFGETFAQGHAILQRQQIFQLFDQGRRGGDIKVKFDLPVVSEFIPTRGFVGAYHYEGNFGSEDLTGLTAGVITFPLRGVSLGAEYYGDDEFYGDNWVFTAGVSAPLDLDNVFNPNEWGRTFAKAFSRRPSTRQPGGRGYLKSRVYSAPERRNWVLNQVSDPIATGQAGETVKTIQDGIIFVNNGGAVGNGIQAGALGGDGTAENPTNSINEGANLVQTSLGGTGTVYVQATGSAYAEEVVVDASGTNVASGVTPVTRLTPAAATNIQFVSSFKGIVACGGFVFGGNTPRADVAGGFYIRDVARAQVQGFSVTGGLTFNPPDPPTPGNQVGAGIVGAGVFDFLVDCNIVNTPATGIGHWVEDVGTGSTRIFDNQVSGPADGTSEVNGTGIFVGVARTGSMGSLEIYDNTVFNTARHGIYVRTQDTGAIAGGRIDTNTVSDTGDFAADQEGRGIYVNGDSNGTGITLASINGNSISRTSGDGIRFQATRRSVMNVGTINGNAISDTTAEVNSGSGVSRSNGAGIVVLATTNNNGAGSSVTVGSIDFNTLTNIDIDNAPFSNNSASDGIRAVLTNAGGGEGMSSLTITNGINNNVLTNVADIGIDIISSNGRNDDATVLTRDLGTLTVGNISGNTVRNSDGTNIRIYGGASGTHAGGTIDRGSTSVVTVGAIANNIVEDLAGASVDARGGDGIEILAQEDSNVTVGAISGNRVNLNDVGGRGIDIVMTDGLLGQPGTTASLTTGMITNNTIRNTLDRGINVELQDVAATVNTVNVAGITGNRLTNIGAGSSGEEGIRVLADDAGDTSQIVIGAPGISNNTLSDIDGEGIGIFARDDKEIILPQIVGNNVSNTVFEGFEANAQQTSRIEGNAAGTIGVIFRDNSFTAIGDNNRGVRLQTQQNSVLTFDQFDGNNVAGANYNSAFQFVRSNTSTITINGTQNNTAVVGSSGTSGTLDEIGTVLGSVIINGTVINPIADTP